MLGVRAFRSPIPDRSAALLARLFGRLARRRRTRRASGPTVLVFGLVPAIGAARVDVNRVLKAGRVEARVRASRWTTAFLTVELALTVIMLANLALGLRLRDRTPAAERTVDRPDIVTASITLTGTGYATPGQRVAFFRSLEERLARRRAPRLQPSPRRCRCRGPRRGRCWPGRRCAEGRAGRFDGGGRSPLLQRPRPDDARRPRAGGVDAPNRRHWRWSSTSASRRCS